MNNTSFSFGRWEDALPEKYVEAIRCFHKKTGETIGIYENMAAYEAKVGKKENYCYTPIKLYGCPCISKEIYYLQFPGIAFTTAEKAYEVGLKYIVNTNGYKYLWSRSPANPLHLHSLTECNEEWMKEVLKKIPISLDEVFFCYLKESNPLLHKKYGGVWKELWKARVIENEWGWENRIEEIDEDRIFL